MAVSDHPGWRALLDVVFGVRRLSGVAAILVLLAVTVVLVGAAIIRHHNHQSASSSLSPAVLPPTVIAKQHAAVATAALTGPAPLLTLSNSTTVMYARAGCRTAPNLMGSASGGVSWVKLAAPAPHLLRLQLTSAKSGYAIGASASCSPARYLTTGTGWSAAGGVGGVWFPTPNGVHSPVGTSTPCGTAHPQPISLASVGAKRAIVICQVGVYLTTSGGRQWGVTGDVPAGHPLSVALTTRNRGVMLLARAPSCAGLRVAHTHDGGVTWQQDSCLSGLRSSAGIALAPNGTGLATAAKTTEYYTTDGGLTWR